jgi:putative component of membrane protein insertase Oxa1/YidC/SpoIIIJ protein YidD
MKWLIQKAIELYWRLIAPSRRRQCVFRETCSVHVHRITRDHGAIQGLFAFFRRAHRCREGYVVKFDEHLNPSLVLVDGTSIGFDEASDSVLAVLNGTANVVRLRLSLSDRGSQ